MTISVRYHFSQRFAVSAKKAFQWCTDFDSKDPILMGEENVERQVNHITNGTIILKDISYSTTMQMEKNKLVQLYPDQLSWISTHLSGPNKYSQFLYRISPENEEASILEFTAFHIEYEDKTNAKLLADRLRIEDANAWKLLANAMEKELRKT